MPDLSIAMIAHNEAHNLPRSLASVQWADQIVVIDSSSTDDTAQVAARLGAEVQTRPNDRNLNTNKNAAIDLCRCDWVLVLDADEVVSDVLAGEIRKVISTNMADGYLIPRRNIVMGRWLRYGSQYPDNQLRLFRRNKGRFPAIHIHERLVVDGRVGELNEAIDHYPYITIKSLVTKGLRDAEFEADYLNAKGINATLVNICWNGFGVSAIRFARRYIFKGGFRDGIPGLIIAVFDCWNRLIRWLKLWELQNNN